MIDPSISSKIERLNALQLNTEGTEFRILETIKEILIEGNKILKLDSNPELLKEFLEEYESFIEDSEAIELGD